MTLITANTTLHSIVLSDPNVITVLNRFNIKLGVGDNTVASICDNIHLNVDFLLNILNTFVNEDYQPISISNIDAKMIIDYLKHTNNYYSNVQIPNIDRHFHLLISHSNNSNSNLKLLYEYFVMLKNELLKRIEIDTSLIFPEIETISNNNKTECINEISYQINKEDNIEEKLSDLKNMFIIHLNGEYDINLCHAVLFAIISLEKDIKQNNRIRSRILIPYINEKVKS